MNLYSKERKTVKMIAGVPIGHRRLNRRTHIRGLAKNDTYLQIIWQQHGFYYRARQDQQ